MFARVIANRYAQAILHDCPDLQTIERVMNELVMLRDTWESQKSFRMFLMNPKMPSSIKQLIIESGFKDRLSGITLNSLKLLISKKRQHILPEVADRYSELCDQVRGVEHADVITAIAIGPELAERLKLAVQRFSSRQIEVTMLVRPDIIGGVVIRLGDRVIDGSLKRRFEDARRAMLAVRLPRTGSVQGSA